MFAFEKPGHAVHPKANDDESMENEWIPIEQISNRKLLIAMRTDWLRLEKRLRRLADDYWQ